VGRDLDFGCSPYCCNGSGGALRPHRQLAMMLFPGNWHHPCCTALGGSCESAAPVGGDEHSSPQTGYLYKPGSHRAKDHQWPSGHSDRDERNGVVYSTGAGHASGLLPRHPPEPTPALSPSPLGVAWLQSPRPGAWATHGLSPAPCAATARVPRPYGLERWGPGGPRQRRTALRRHT
jgi:hypothetical protein